LFFDPLGRGIVSNENIRTILLYIYKCKYIYYKTSCKYIISI
jgi:hypothetical protein